MEVNKKTFLPMIIEWLENEEIELRNKLVRIVRERETLNYAKDSKFFRITTEDGIRFKWSASLVKSRFEVWLDD